MENGQQPHGRRRMRPGSQYLNNMTTPPLMWDDSISTPFPFFQLPREIRDHIYAELFLSKRKDKIVTPDLGRTRRKPNAQCKANRYSRRRLAYRTLNLTSLAFLRTCQQACDEAADVLYGKHVFHFSDQPHLEKPSANTALSWASNEHRMPLCDFVTVLAFFRSLSSTSRKKLHHLQIEFLTRGLVAPSASSEIAWESHPLRGGPDLVEVLKMVTAEFELRTFRVVFNKPLQSYNDHYFLMETFWNLLKYSFLRQECYGPNSVLERAQMNIVNAIDALQVTQDMTQRLPDDAHLLADPEKGFLLTGNRKGSRALPRRRQQFPREVSLYASEPFNQWYASRLTSQLKAKVLCLTGESLRDRLILQAVYEEHVSKNLSADMVELFLGQVSDNSRLPSAMATKMGCNIPQRDASPDRVKPTLGLSSHACTSKMMRKSC